MKYAKWLIIASFFIPLGVVPGRFCSLDFVDASYHWLIALHEHMGVVFALLAVMSLGSAASAYVRARRRINELAAVSSPAPPLVADAFARAAKVGQAYRLIYVDVPQRFCFSEVGCRIICSSAFAAGLDLGGLASVAQHELLHLQRRDPQRALMWHLLLALLIVPGFERLERALYDRRERIVSARMSRQGAITEGPAARLSHDASRRTMFGARVLVLARSSMPIIVLVMLAASHVAFLHEEPFLLAHHC